MSSVAHFTNKRHCTVSTDSAASKIEDWFNLNMIDRRLGYIFTRGIYEINFDSSGRKNRYLDFLDGHIKYILPLSGRFFKP